MLVFPAAFKLLASQSIQPQSYPPPSNRAANCKSASHTQTHTTTQTTHNRAHKYTRRVHTTKLRVHTLIYTRSTCYNPHTEKGSGRARATFLHSVHTNTDTRKHTQSHALTHNGHFIRPSSTRLL